MSNENNWYWQDHRGMHGPLSKESAEAANEKFGIGLPIEQKD